MPGLPTFPLVEKFKSDVNVKALSISYIIIQSPDEEYDDSPWESMSVAMKLA